MVHTFNWNAEADLVYRVSSRTTGATQKSSVLGWGGGTKIQCAGIKVCLLLMTELIIISDVISDTTTVMLFYVLTFCLFTCLVVVVSFDFCSIQTC